MATISKLEQINGLIRMAAKMKVKTRTKAETIK